MNFGLIPWLKSGSKISKHRGYHDALIRFTLVGVVLLFSGCNSGPSGPAYAVAKSSIPTLSAEAGRIFVYRQSRFTGSAWNSPILLNGQSIGEIPSGAFLYVDRPPGDYTMICILGFSGYKNPEAAFALAAGQTIYLRVVTDMTGVGLEVIPPVIAGNEIVSTQFNPPSADLKAAKISTLIQPAARGQSLGQNLAKPDFLESRGDANGAGIATTPDEAEKILELKPATSAAGLYALDDQTPFNVLDSVYYDPSNDVLSLVGHFDDRYRGPKIPYLQHLAVLLQNPKPEFSLNWTPESERKMDAFFSQHVIEGLSASEADNLMAKWGRIVDDQNNLTRAGRLLVSAMGLTPIEGGRAPGEAGVRVSMMPGAVTLRVTSVTPGSAAEQAGLRAGDIIKTIRGRSPLTPFEFARRIRLSGEGQTINLTYQRPGAGPQVFSTRLTPTASPDTDPWKWGTSYDLLQVLYFATGDFKASFAINIAGMMDRAKRGGGSDEIKTELRNLLINALGLRGAVNADIKATDENAMTEVAAFRDIYLKICQGLDETFHFPGSPVGDAYLQAYQRRGGDPSNGIPTAMDEFDRQMLPKVKELLNVVFARPEGLQIPPELVEEQFHLQPEMVPQYLGLPGDSLLAQVMFDSDYLGKRLMNRPDLKQKISAYQTGFEFEVKNPQFRHATGTYRVWISVAKLDTPQSPDGTTLALRDLTMRFNVRDQDGSRKDLPNQPGSYEELLTSLWNDFEVEYPTLHELRETAKLAAAARWMLAHNPSAALPAAGRVRWQGPGKVPGLVFMELAPDPVRGMNKTHVTTIAEGGVSEAPPADFQGEPFPSDTSVVDLRGTAFGGPPAGTHVYTATAPSHGASDSSSSPLSMGWVGQLDASDGAKSAVVVTSTFGSKAVKVDFSGEQKALRVVGDNTKAGDQLKAAAATATSGGNLTKNFDVGGAHSAGSLPTVTTGSSEVERMKAWEKMKNDPRMAPLIPLLEAYGQLQTKRDELNTERDELTLKRNQAQDTTTMQQLSAELKIKDKEYQDNLVALAAKKDEVAKAKRLIDTSEEGGAAVPDASNPHVTPEPTPVPADAPIPDPTPPEEPKTPTGGGAK
jgi:hypothetical protein